MRPLQIRNIKIAEIMALTVFLQRKFAIPKPTTGKKFSSKKGGYFEFRLLFSIATKSVGYLRCFLRSARQDRALMRDHVNRHDENPKQNRTQKQPFRKTVIFQSEVRESKLDG